MALVKKEKSVIYSISKLVTATAGVPVNLGTVLFSRNEQVKIRSMSFFMDTGKPAYLSGFFLDQDLNNVQLNPMKGFFGFSDSDVISSTFVMIHGRQTFFENLKAWALQFNAFVSDVDIPALDNKIIIIQIEVMEEYTEEQFQ
jgi:hypothetical protein